MWGLRLGLRFDLHAIAAQLVVSGVRQAKGEPLFRCGAVAEATERNARRRRTADLRDGGPRYSLDRPGKGGRGCFLAQSIGNISTERQQRRIRRSGGHAGGESSDAATIWKHGAADRRAAIADGIGAAPRKQTGRTKERDGEVYKKSFEMSHFRTRGGRTGPFPGLPRSLGMERIRNGSNGGRLIYNR